MSFVSFLQAAAGSASTTGSLTSLIVTVAMMIGIFYFFLIRPQNKKQKETENMLKSLKKGDKVITIGGIHGTVSSVDEKTVILKVDDNTKIKFNLTAVADKISGDAATPAAKEKKSDASAEEKK